MINISIRTTDKLKGVEYEWELLPGTEAENIVFEDGQYWVVFPGDVLFSLHDALPEKGIEIVVHP